MAPCRDIRSVHAEQEGGSGIQGCLIRTPETANRITSRPFCITYAFSSPPCWTTTLLRLDLLGHGSDNTLGLLVAPLTPFTQNLEINTHALGRQIEYIVASCGATMLIAAGVEAQEYT